MPNGLLNRFAETGSRRSRDVLSVIKRRVSKGLTVPFPYVPSESFMRLIKVVPRDPRPFVTGVFCIFKEVVAMEEGWPEWPHHVKRKRRCDSKW